MSVEGDAVVQEPVKDEVFGKEEAVVAYVELKNELGLPVGFRACH